MIEPKYGRLLVLIAAVPVAKRGKCLQCALISDGKKLGVGL